MAVLHEPGETELAQSSLSALKAMRATGRIKLLGIAGGGDVMDAYVSTVGGVRLGEPAADLATALALASAAQDKPLPQRLVCFGEIGLAGEVRPVPEINRRIQEVARLGFTHAVVPASPTGPGKIPAGFSVREVTTVGQALELLFPARPD